MYAQEWLTVLPETPEGWRVEKVSFDRSCGGSRGEYRFYPPGSQRCTAVPFEKLPLMYLVMLAGRSVVEV